MKENRAAIVVGGAGGIGSDICRKLASQGYRVAVADFNLEGAQQVLAGLQGTGHRVTRLDVTSEESVNAAFDAFEDFFPDFAVFEDEVSGFVNVKGEVGFGDLFAVTFYAVFLDEGLDGGEVGLGGVSRERFVVSTARGFLEGEK